MTITAIREGSPFDAIRRTREDGAEYWSARDLMPLLGYPEWREFRPAVERAWKSAEAQGHAPEDLFGVITEKGLGRPREDVNDLKVWAAANLPGVKVLHQDVRDIAGHVGLIIRGDTVRNNQPTARAIEAGWVKPHEAVYDTDTRGRQVAVSTRLTPRGYARLWDACIAHYSRKQVAA